MRVQPVAMSKQGAPGASIPDSNHESMGRDIHAKIANSSKKMKAAKRDSKHPRIKYLSKLGFVIPHIAMVCALLGIDASLQVFSIKEETKTKLLEASLGSSSYTKDLSGFLKSSACAVGKILVEANEEGLVGALRDFQASDATAILLRNIPIDPCIPPTPTDGSRSLGKASTVAEFVAAGVSQLAGGNLIGYGWEKEYSHPAFHEGFPLKQKGSALNTGRSLSYHSDMAYLAELERIPDVLTLICLREGHDHRVITSLIDNRSLVRLVPEELRVVLREARFVFEKPRWIEDFVEVEQSVLIEDERKEMVYLKMPASGFVVPKSNQDFMAWKALYYLVGTLSGLEGHDDSVNNIHLLPGDLLMFKNKDVLHSRQIHEQPRFDGGDRVVIRSYWVFDASASRQLEGDFLLKERDVCPHT